MKSKTHNIGLTIDSEDSCLFKNHFHIVVLPPLLRFCPIINKRYHGSIKQLLIDLSRQPGSVM